MALTWKKVLESIGPRRHIEAAGAFALAYNDLEFSLYGLLSLTLQDDEDLVPFLFTELNNSQKANFIRHVIKRVHSGWIVSHVSHALTCFGICAENRNLIMHASPAPVLPLPDVLHVVKPVKGRPGDMNEYTFSLVELREAARSAFETSRYIYELVDAIWESNVGSGPSTWPGKPQIPRKLSLSLRPEPPEGG